MNTSTISFNANTQGGPLEISVCLDSHTIYQSEITEQKQKINVILDQEDKEQDHVMEIHMRGKLASHTQLDNFGFIVADRLLEISDITLDDINISHTFFKNARYRHDFNGTEKETEEQFYGTMGCNGTVTINFSTPMYLWFLKNN